MFYRLFLVLLPLSIAGCAVNNGPSNMAPEPKISVEQVQSSPGTYKGQQVQWGGEIIKVINKPEITLIEVLSRPLSSRSKPLDKTPEGRFLVEMDRFVDPAQYPESRKLTVTGTVKRVEDKLIGEYKYAYPVVDASNMRLWPREQNIERHYYHPDPFFHPYYPGWPHRPYWRIYRH